MIEVKRGVFNFCNAGSGYPCVVVRTVRDEVDIDGFWHYTIDEFSHKVYYPEHLAALSGGANDDDDGAGAGAAVAAAGPDMLLSTGDSFSSDEEHVDACSAPPVTRWSVSSDNSAVFGATDNDSTTAAVAATPATLMMRGRLFPAPSHANTLMDLRYGAHWRTTAVCTKLRGDRFYGPMPMAARLQDGVWVRVGSLSSTPQQSSNDGAEASLQTTMTSASQSTNQLGGEHDVSTNQLGGEQDVSTTHASVGGSAGGVAAGAA
jgi:hypothetical protein